MLPETILDDICLLSQYKEACDLLSFCLERKHSSVLSGKSSHNEDEPFRFATLILSECKEAIHKRLIEKEVQK